MKVGLLLQENPTACAETIVEWLAEEATPMRLDLACALLVGLWTPTSRACFPTAEVLTRLVRLRPSRRTEPDAEYSYALAMSRVADARNGSAETTAVARRELDLAARRGTGDPVLDQNLFGLRARLVPSSGASVDEFRAYAVSGNDPVLFVLQRSGTHEDIAKVVGLSEAGSTLTVRYHKLVPTLSNLVCVDAIEAGLLTSLLEKEHRSRIFSVEYVDDGTPFKVTAPYPKSSPNEPR